MDVCKSMARWLRYAALCVPLTIDANLSNNEKAADLNALLISAAFFISRWRREGDLNPRAGITRLLVFEASPFSLLGTSPHLFHGPAIWGAVQTPFSRESAC